MLYITEHWFIYVIIIYLQFASFENFQILKFFAIKLWNLSISLISKFFNSLKHTRKFLYKEGTIYKLDKWKFLEDTSSSK